MASDLHKDMAGQPLLRGVSFKLESRERMTVAGRNGTGKTTLLRMLAGEESIDRGEVTLARGARVALHDQRPPRERALSLRDYVLSGCAEELTIEAELNRLEQAMAGGGGDEATLSRYSRAQARLEARGGYRWRDRATAMVHGLGFVDADLDRPLATFSGGELTRASLARALAGEPDLLLLDEPTNHLDIESLEWLEQHADRPRGRDRARGHDRWFLEAVGTAVLELEAGPAASRASSPGRGTRGARSRPRASWRSAARSSASRRRSPASSASWTASGRGRGLARPSRASRSSTAWTASIRPPWRPLAGQRR